MSYKYVILEVSPRTYREIERLLKQAGYDHAFQKKGTQIVMDMHGIALGKRVALTEEEK